MLKSFLPLGLHMCVHVDEEIQIDLQGGPSALGKNYVDTKFEVAFSCKFIL